MLSERDKIVLEAIRKRADERKAASAEGIYGGVREWFEVESLLQIIDKLTETPDGFSGIDIEDCTFCSHIYANRELIREKGGVISKGESHLRVIYPEGESNG